MTTSAIASRLAVPVSQPPPVPSELPARWIAADPHLGRADDEVESLIADPRGGLTPAEMVEQKLVALLKGGMVPLSQVRVTSLPRGRGLS